ncbi:MAG: GPW/gp25 family protein [Thermodesulfobacteriota bacterium]|nr:GPW/gp25 family protein [Thermodesulfobacteriota bacterium]
MIDDKKSKDIKRNQPGFLGTGWTFPPTFTKGPQSVVMVSDDKDIRQSLEILLTTSVGERFLRPEYGCDLRRYLFEPLDDGLVAYIRDLVGNAILYHEPRIRLTDLTLSTRAEEGTLLIELEYVIRTTNSRRNFVFPFYKDEGTDVKQ